ncbi:hypothetical protein F2Q69_00001265 [Brassica cretica]|uniref:Uncharacterized protein n=1 Tax=Brassica cretica TaxID=69181 RepID=A0A8S9P2Y4_BRACR|nr:hypothetical protein F2Q69_00001265 [Brassica cretica]
MAFLMGCPLKVVAFPASFLPPLTSKKPAMVVKCYTGNQRACRVLEDTMNRLEIPLTPEVKRLVKKSSGTFKTRVFDLYAEIQKKKGFNVKKRWFKLQQKPSKNLCFFPGKRTMNTSGLNSSKNKHPPMQLVCKSNNGT